VTRRGGWAAAAAAAVVALVAAITAVNHLSDGGSPDPTTAQTTAGGEGDGTGSSTGTPRPAEVREATWLREVGDFVTGDNPWLSQVFGAGDTWLARVIAGESGSVFVPFDAATGAGPSTPLEPTLPEDMFCADRVWRGALLCAWDDAVHTIDPATGEVGAAPWASQAGVQWLGVDATDDAVVAVGMRGFDPVVTAFSAEGVQRWSRDVLIDGCPVESPEYRVEIEQVAGEGRIALAAYRFAVDLADGRVLVAACGVAAFTPGGALAVGQVYGDEPAPPASYTGADGTGRLVLDVGMASQVVAFAAAGGEFCAVMDDSERLRLYDAATGELAWELPWPHGLVQTWDEASLYATGREGLSAVSLDTGEILWAWAGGAGLAVRTAVLTESGGLVVGTSAGVSGLDPVTGAEAWVVEDPYLAGWYWTQAGTDPASTRTTDVVGYIGAEHTTLARIDAPRLG
jgi:hypothetical protein